MTPYEQGYQRFMKLAGILEGEPETSDYALAGLEGAGAAVLAPGAYERGLGLKRLYHGTITDEAARAIREEGLRASFGGTGAAQITPGYVSESAGKIHVTPQRHSGNIFASVDFREGMPLDMDARAARALVGTHPRNIVIDMPQAKYDRMFHADPDFFPTEAFPGAEEVGKQFFAGRSTEDLPSRYMRGGKGHSRLRTAVEALGELPGYAVRHPGRFGLGLAGAAGAGALGHDALQRAGLIEDPENTLWNRLGDAAREQTQALTGIKLRE